MREKYSGGPNLSANLAKGGAANMIEKVAIVPAIKDA